MRQFCVRSVCVFSMRGDCDSFVALSLDKSPGCQIADRPALVRRCHAPIAPLLGEVSCGEAGETTQTSQPKLAGSRPVGQVGAILVIGLDKPKFRKCLLLSESAFVVCCAFFSVMPLSFSL